SLLPSPHSLLFSVPLQSNSIIMSNAIFNIPTAINEPVLDYAPGSKERELLKAAIREAYSNVGDIPMYIGGKEVRTNKKVAMHPPHDHQKTIANYHAGDKTHVQQAIDAALKAKQAWADMNYEQRASIFLKAADL